MSIRTREKTKLTRGKTKPTRDSRENKTNWFPEASCLSLMLYSFTKKKTSNPAICHATFHHTRAVMYPERGTFDFNHGHVTKNQPMTVPV